MLSLYKVTRAAFDATSKWIELQLRGAGDEGDDAASEPVDKSPLIQSIGFAVRPVVARTLRALGYQHGDEVLSLKIWDRAKNPTDLASGETRVYSAGAVQVVIKLLSNNRIEITANGGSVIINGGSTPVAKEGSATTGHTHAAGALIAGPYAVTGATASSTDTVATGQGSATVKVP